MQHGKVSMKRRRTHAITALVFWLLLGAEGEETCQTEPAVGDGPLLSHGWKVSKDDLDGPCTLDRIAVSDLAQEVFERMREEKPFVLFDGLDRQSDFRSRCAKDALLSRWAETEITLSTANTFSHDKTYLSFGQYISDYVSYPQDEDISGKDTLLFFGDNNYTEWEELFSKYTLPPLIPPGAQTSLSFGVGGPNSGVPFHVHGAGFSESIIGRKRWFLTPPGRKPVFDPEQTTIQWVRRELTAARANPYFQECVVHPGEMIFFPTNWWHATLNLDESVFISTFVNFPKQKYGIESHLF